MINFENTLSKVANFFSNKDVENYNYSLDFFDITDFFNKEKIYLLNGRYIRLGKKLLFSFNNVDNLNIENKNTQKIVSVFDKYKTNFKVDEFYKRFILVSEVEKLDYKKYKGKKVFGFDLDLNKVRGNVFSFKKGGQNYKMFAISVNIDEILLYKDFSFPNLKIFEFNLYHPLIFFKELFLYFYEKSKTIFFNEDIKIKNYIKSVGINLDNFTINLKKDDYFLKKLKKITQDDIFYKMFLLVYKQIGLVGYIWVDIYVFAYDKGKTLELVTPVLSPSGEIYFIGTGKEFVYIKLLEELNRYGTSSFSTAMILNEKRIESLKFYSFDDIDKVLNFVSK